MQNLEKHERGQGFTLVELLVVVAIIAVLVAVSIPIFSSQLEKARKATDMANERAAKAAALTYYYSYDPSIPNYGRGWATFAYDADSGKVYASSGYNIDSRITKGYNKSETYTYQAYGTAIVIISMQKESTTGNGIKIVKGWYPLK